MGSGSSASKERRAKFVKDAIFELKRFVPYSFAVRSVESQVERFIFTSNRPEKSLESCRKMSAALASLTAFADKEPEELDFIVGANW